MAITKKITGRKSVITIATGKPYYINLAVNLARSFLYWHPESEIQFWLVTDQPQLIPDDVASLINIKIIEPNEYGNGFSTKLFLDEFVETQYSLFIDADCLVYSNLDPVFEQFKGYSVSAIGDNIVDGDFFCDVKQVIEKLELQYMPRFVGGVYYLEQNEVSKKIFEKARQLLPMYDDLGLIRLRGKENEEPLVALGMASYAQKTIPEDGSIKADRMSYEKINSNLLLGKAELQNKNMFATWVKVKKSNPMIVHYNGNYAEDYYYQCEVIRLHLYSLIKNKILVSAMIYPGTLLYLVKYKMKEFLRPYYNFLFGYRKVKLHKR